LSSLAAGFAESEVGETDGPHEGVGVGLGFFDEGNG
jgi:hypothetical protein